MSARYILLSSESDISLFSSLLGYLFAGKPIDDLNFTIQEPYRSDYEDLADETDRVAYIMWLLWYWHFNFDLINNLFCCDKGFRTTLFLPLKGATYQLVDVAIFNQRA